MNNSLLTALQKLLNAEGDQLSASNLTSAQQRALDDLRQRTQALMQKRSGRGRVYQILNRGVLEQHLTELAPTGHTDLADTLPQRATNIGRARSSKIGRQKHDRHYLLLRAQGKPGWQNDRGQSLDLAHQTEAQGAATIALGSAADPLWRTDSPIWLVENQALFDRLDWLPDSGNISIGWYSGQLRHQLIHWLSQLADTPVTLFPDYDGVGLHNYLRLKQHLGSRARLWLMPHWQEKLHQYGNNRLWQDTYKDFRVAAAGLADLFDEEPELKQLIERLQSTGLALEQEAVWL